MSRPTAVFLDHEIIKIEDSPEPMPSTPTLASSNTMTQPLDPKDPEGFLRRCSGYNKKKGVRCSAIIGRNSHHVKHAHSTFLPTCYTHRDQQSHAGWCQFVQEDGEKCGRLFRWTPPYFELCAEHQGHPDTPCHFMKLPLELRLDVFRYLLPSRAIGSSTSLLHIDEDPDQQQPWYHSTGSSRVASRNSSSNMHSNGSHSSLDRSTMRSVFPIPLANLLLVNHQVHEEVKDLLYSTVPFTVDVRKDGTFMCGRRLLEPRRADGSSHYVVGDVDKIKERFLRTFDWAAVKNYNVDILVENWKDDTNRGYHTFPWDEEVEIYDIRDYIGVVISGILSKARNLCRLNVRLGFSKFIWTEEELYTNIKTLVGPFERLRNVRQPRFLGVYEGTPQTNFMISLPVPGQAASFTTPTNGSPHARPSTPLCSVPQLPTRTPLFVCTQPEFAEYRSNWERWIASASATSLISKPPIRAMFTELKEFYTRLAATVPDVTARNGRHAFLHRARVAREQENVEAFRHLRNELIGYWEAYLEQEERKKDDMSRRLSRMLDVDVYPASWDEDHACIVGANSQAIRSAAGSSSQSPIITSAESWRNAAKRSPPGKLHSTYPPSTSLTPQHHSHSQAGSSRCNAGSNAQDPVIIDLGDDDCYTGERQRMESTRLQAATRDVMRDATWSKQPLQPHNTPLHSPISSDGQMSPRSSRATLQPSKDQQPMALNPQLHLEAAMSHRRQVEMQAHRARAMQEAASRQAMAQAQALAQRQSIFGYPPGYPPVVMHPDTMLQSQYQHVTAQAHVSVSPSASSSFSPVNELPPSAARGPPVEVAYNQHMPPDWYICYDPPVVDIPEQSSQKRPASDTEDTELPEGKRQRVDSGMGWADEGYGTQRELGEDENEAVAVDVQMVYHHQDTNRGRYPEYGPQAKMDWKGKGKARAEEPECA